MKFKKVAALVLASAMTLGLAACGGTQGSSETPPGSSNAPASETSSGGAVELNLWSFNIGGFTDAAAWEPIVAAFNEANPDIKVTVTPINYQDGDQKLTSAITSGSGPDIIFEGPERIVGNYAREGLMVDLGDLREGYWDHEEMVQTCLYVERRLPHVHLSGVGVNLSCYGSVRATPEKMQMLLAIARRVEDAIGRPLEIVSGGATSSYPMIHTGTMPAGINHLRIGENILTAQDIADSWGIHDADYLRDDVFRLEAEVVEVKEKPTYPQGELGADAFGRKPVYEDRGLRLRAILALGRADVGDMETLRPTMPGVTVVGGSSDHCILDVTDAPQPVQVGDVLSFRLCYSHVLYATQRDDVPVVICP